MRNRNNNNNNSRSKSSASSNSGGNNSFRRASNKPEAESRFSKPSIKKSSLRVASSAPTNDKPKSFRPRAFEKGDGFSDFQNQNSKPGFDKPRSERPRFPKAGTDKPRFSESRDFRRDNTDKPSFGDNRSERPRFSERPERESRPRTEAPSGRSFKPGFDQRDSEFRSFKKDTDRGASNRSERTSTGRSEKPSFKKKDEPVISEQEAIEEAANRRVGKFETAPNYRLEQFDKKSGSKKKVEESGERRLNRYIANAGICSRREADELISSGQISVNGKIITEMGYKVSNDDVVKFGKKKLNPEKFVYILINKPKDYITTTDDPEERKTVLDLIKGACFERVYPVGRLDRNTTGLLLMTNDGELAKKLTHPSSEIRKIYQAELDKPITTEDFEKLQAGLNLEDGFIRPDEAGLVTPDAMVVGLEIHSGRNRIVRRMFEHLGYTVQKLDRTVFAGLDKKDLPRGKWRFLAEKEVVRLKYMM
jgi:23S rRNA pseudouridine2605 synthase